MVVVVAMVEVEEEEAMAEEKEDPDGDEGESGSRGSLLALPRHLSTTRPCSPGEKTRQPTPRTHLVSSGPSIRRDSTLLLYLSSISLSFHRMLFTS